MARTEWPTPTSPQLEGFPWPCGTYPVHGSTKPCQSGKQTRFVFQACDGGWSFDPWGSLEPPSDPKLGGSGFADPPTWGGLRFNPTSSPAWWIALHPGGPKVH